MGAWVAVAGMRRQSGKAWDKPGQSGRTTVWSFPCLVFNFEINLLRRTWILQHKIQDFRKLPLPQSASSSFFELNLHSSIKNRIT
jgi:hypothetical protein